MRIAALVLVLVAACQRAGDPAEESARKVSEVSAAQPITAPAPIAEPEHACGGACGGSCNGHCGASCTAGMPELPKANVPADASWIALEVEGMHCGGCARRIQTRLAQLDGVVGSEVDLGTHTVRVAVKKGVDARAIAAPAINELGYRVVR
ncbi:MAG TPA: heavy metal-associated domain-containing protein [Kofleriaceae bacterium]|nr:heavy metal-associated domain-containing protein [Kofleriaceae bacterium]